jgi:hypothetical protein
MCLIEEVGQISHRQLAKANKALDVHQVPKIFINLEQRRKILPDFSMAF